MAPPISSQSPRVADPIVPVQATPTPPQQGTADAATPAISRPLTPVISAPDTTTIPLPLSLASPAQMAAAQRERETLLSARRLLGTHYDTWYAARNTTYQNITLAILRMGYYLQGSQMDTGSFLLPLRAWARAAEEGQDPVFRQSMGNLVQVLGEFQDPLNIERAFTLSRMTGTPPPSTGSGTTPLPQGGTTAPETPPAIQRGRRGRRGRTDTHPTDRPRTTPPPETPNPPPTAPTEPTPPSTPPPPPPVDMDFTRPDAGPMVPPPSTTSRRRRILPTAADGGTQ